MKRSISLSGPPRQPMEGLTWQSKALSAPGKGMRSPAADWLSSWLQLKGDGSCPLTRFGSARPAMRRADGSRKLSTCSSSEKGGKSPS
jgi:hypothetical protein